MIHSILPRHIDSVETRCTMTIWYRHPTRWAAHQTLPAATLLTDHDDDHGAKPTVCPSTFSSLDEFWNVDRCTSPNALKSNATQRDNMTLPNHWESRGIDILSTDQNPRPHAGPHAGGLGLLGQRTSTSMTVARHIGNVPSNISSRHS